MRILVPPAFVVGREYVVPIEITAEKATKVDSIEATLDGRQGWVVGSGKSRVAHEVKFPTLVTTLMGEGELPAGTARQFSMRFTLPPGTAPSHGVAPAWANMRLKVRISIPWWLDARYSFDVDVRLPPPPRVERTPVAIRSTPASAAPDTPRIEVSLASSRLVAGEVVVGSVAVFHMDDRKPRDVDLEFVPMLWLLGRGRIRERRGRPFSARITLPAGSAGTSVPFAIELPARLVPSFETASHKLEWWLVAESGSFFGKKVEVSIPLQIVDAAAAATTERLTVAPRLADERIAALFAAVAARAGWRPGKPDDDDEPAISSAIERDVDGGEVQIAYAYRGQEGAFLVSRIEHPSLGLGLAVTPSSALRHVFWRDVEVDIDTWDRAHHVAARFPGQAIPFLRAVVPALMKAEHLGAMVRWDDTSITFERAVASVEEHELGPMTAVLEQLAATIAGARGEIASPPDVTVDVAGYRELATWLDGDLALGDLSIEGTLDGLPAAVTVEWHEQRPVRVRASLGDPEVVGEELRRQAFQMARPAADALGLHVPERVVDCLTRWPAEIIELVVENGVATASFLLPLEGRVEIAVPRVRELVLALRALIGALGPETSPYR